MHIELLLEEPSAEAFMQGFLPKVLLEETTWNPIVFQGKSDLLKNLQSRLKAYRKWMPADYRIVVLIDEDRVDCRSLKQQLEAAAVSAGLTTKSTTQGGRFVVLNRIAIEELEAWYFGDPDALVRAYPGVPSSLGKQSKYRDADAVVGGTWEALERVLQRAGHFKGGLSKIELARAMAKQMQPSGNRSRSFRRFVEGLASLQEQVTASRLNEL